MPPSPLRVIHVVESFGAGTLTMVVNISAFQADLGLEVHVIHSVREETPSNYCDMFHKNVRLYNVKMTRELRPHLDLFSLIALYKLLRRLKPDVLHLHSSKAGFLGRVAGRLVGCAAIFYSPHGISFLRQDISRNKRRLFIGLEKFASYFGGCVVACSKGELAEIQKEVGRGQTAIVENGIDNPFEAANRVCCDGEVKIGTAGRITAQKNPGLFAVIARQLPQFRFIWIGDGSVADRALLEGASVHVTGWVERETACKHIAELDVYIQTSLWEGMPVTLIEAMTAGLPTVVSDCVGNRDVVLHGQTGFVAKSPTEFICYLQLLAAYPSLRTTMGHSGRHLAVDHYSTKRMNEEILALYEKAVSKDCRKLPAQSRAGTDCEAVVKRPLQDECSTEVVS